MFRLPTRRRLAAFTLIEVMVVSGIMTGLQSQGGYRYAINAANQAKGVNNLQQIYGLLQAQSVGAALPEAAFYPKGDPRKDPKSILRLIEGAPAALFVSPFAPDALQKKGLTYAWNDTVNGKDISQLPQDTWLLVDMAAFIVDPNMEKPERYLVLYADGRAEASPNPPADIIEAVKAAQAKAKAPAAPKPAAKPARRK